MFYNNSIESQHFREKKEQCFKKGTVQGVIATVKSLVTRQEDDEVRAIYGSGPYRLNKPFKKFEVDSIKWHRMDPLKRKKHVDQFQKYSSNIEKHFQKSESSERKPNERKRVRKTQAKIFIDRIEKPKEVNLRPKYSSQIGLRTSS